MKFRILLLCLIMSPALAHAEIYKWKDKNGAVRYSDVPPPSNVPQELLYGKKIPKSANAAPLSPVNGDITDAIERNKAADKQKAAGKVAPLSKDDAAKKRADDAEKQKKEDEVKQAELKYKQENCKIAQANFKTYLDGGRLVKTNEQGQREFLSDQDIEQGKKDAQADIAKYCDGE